MYRNKSTYLYRFWDNDIVNTKNFPLRTFIWTMIVILLVVCYWMMITVIFLIRDKHVHDEDWGLHFSHIVHHVRTCFWFCFKFLHMMIDDGGKIVLNVWVSAWLLEEESLNSLRTLHSQLNPFIIFQKDLEYLYISIKSYVFFIFIYFSALWKLYPVLRLNNVWKQVLLNSCSFIN